MNISKFDLYKTEWLDLVFAKRNKEYGAYQLRQHSAETTSKAMVITFVTVVSAMLALSFVVRAKPAEVYTRTDITLKSVQPPPVPPKKEEPPKAALKHSTIQFIPPVVVPQTPPVEPPKLVDMQKPDIGQETVDIPGDGITDPGADAVKGGDATVTKIAEPEKIYEGGVDVEPEPYGGAAAWAKFLQKNLKYPAMAVEQGMQGRVIITFVVEKNGHISSYEVLRGPGYGMNEEALRVLKMAPPWKPGLQHGQPVRVKYTLPFNFTLNND